MDLQGRKIGISYLCCIIFILFSCTANPEKIKPTVEDITESVYASGMVKAANQYQAFANTSGIIQEFYVREGDSVNVGTPVLLIRNEPTRLNRELAELSNAFADSRHNKNRLDELELRIITLERQVENDSLLYRRQVSLRNQGIGSLIELEQRQLAYENSRNALSSSKANYAELKREIEFNEKSAAKNLAISRAMEEDLILRSQVEGRVYALLKEEGEMVSAQTALAVIGSATDFYLELKVDEYDIVKVKKGQPVLVSMDSYRGQVFEAMVTRINPIMDEASKSFTAEAIFTQSPSVLYPNLTLEANILTAEKQRALTIPRSYLLNDKQVILSNGDTVTVEVGLRDFQKAEILSGLSQGSELIKPVP